MEYVEQPFVKPTVKVGIAPPTSTWSTSVLSGKACPIRRHCAVPFAGAVFNSFADTVAVPEFADGDRRMRRMASSSRLGRLPPAATPAPAPANARIAARRTHHRLPGLARAVGITARPGARRTCPWRPRCNDNPPGPAESPSPWRARRPISGRFQPSGAIAWPHSHRVLQQVDVAIPGKVESLRIGDQPGCTCAPSWQQSPRQ